MGARFNLFDLLVYAIPGATVLLLLWLNFGVGVDLKDYQIAGTAIAFLVSYLAGHVVYLLRLGLVRIARLEHAELKRQKALAAGEEHAHDLEPLNPLRQRPEDWPAAILGRLITWDRKGLADSIRTPYYSEKLLEDDRQFPEPLRLGMQQTIEDRFGIPQDGDSNRQAGWNCARTAVDERGLSSRAELYNSMGNMYSNLALVFQMALPITVLGLLARLLGLSHGSNLFFCLLVGSLLLALVPVIGRQARNLHQSFARETLLVFYVSCRDQTSPSDGASAKREAAAPD